MRILLAAVFLTCTLKASVIYDNFGTGYAGTAYSFVTGNPGYPPSLPEFYPVSYAVAFTPAAGTWSLSSLTAVINSPFGSTGSVGVNIVADDGRASGPPLDSFVFALNGSSGPITVASMSHAVLTGGVKYWAIAVGSSTPLAPAWYATTLAIGGTVERSVNNGPWNEVVGTNLPTLRVEGTSLGGGGAAVPEPGAGTLFALGAAGVLACRRLRSK